jgi:hypothetical protein
MKLSPIQRRSLLIFLLLVWAGWLIHRLYREDKGIRAAETKEDRYMDSIEKAGRK